MTGHDYYNISQFDFEKLMDDSNAIEANLRDYINGFSEDVREIMDNFEIFGVIDKLSAKPAVLGLYSGFPRSI